MTGFGPSKPIASNVPLFTVLIPTMNRPQLLESAIQSVLWQSFKDFEVIISDNSSNEDTARQNRKTVEKYLHDCRLRYIRPPEWMNMPDHWEFASLHATGQYVIVLTDRFVMRPSALELLGLKISQFRDDAKVIYWHSGSSLSPMGILDTSPFTGAIEVVESKDMVGEFAKLGAWRTSPSWVNRLPRTLINCYRSDVARLIREKHGRLFMPIAPDYTSAFLLLAYTDRVVYVDRPLFINHGNQSNGQKSLVYGSKEYISTLGNVDMFDNCRITFNTVTDSIIRDLIMVKNMVGISYSDVDIDIVGFFMNNYREFQQMERVGSLIDVTLLYSQWWESVKRVSLEQQKLINQHVKELQKQRSSFIGLRRLSVRLKLSPLYSFLIMGFRQIHHRLAGKPVYANVLVAARQTDYMVSSGQKYNKLS